MQKDEKLQVLLSERKAISDAREVLRKDMAAMDIVIEGYCKRNNVCVHCEGTGEFYVDSSSDGDPNHRSSDDRHDCSQCNGTGKYKGGK